MWSTNDLSLVEANEFIKIVDEQVGVSVGKTERAIPASRPRRFLAFSRMHADARATLSPRI